MSAFTKLHATILDSSIWQEPAHVRLVWITMLAMADADGVVQASVGGLSHRARVTREECVDALERFRSPDHDSRDGTTGERIEDVIGGWLLLNHANYRDRQTHQQTVTAERVRKHRATRAGITVAPDSLPSVTEPDVTLPSVTRPDVTPCNAAEPGVTPRNATSGHVTRRNATSPDISPHLPTSPSEAEAEAEAYPDAMDGRMDGGVRRVVGSEGAGSARSTSRPMPAGSVLGMMQLRRSAEGGAS